MKNDVEILSRLLTALISLLQEKDVIKKEDFNNHFIKITAIREQLLKKQAEAEAAESEAESEAEPEAEPEAVIANED